MSRVLFAKRAQGAIIKRIQQKLSQEGYYSLGLDGDYWVGTESAVRQFQADKGLVATGKVDDVTWEKLMGEAIPGVQDRCLQLTAAFEGHGFGKICGNWDGAWLTWGIVGFTLKHGELSRIVLEVFENDPEAVKEAFGNLTDELIRMMHAPGSEEEAWGNMISEGPKRYDVKEPWKSAFARFGENEIVQRIQIRHAHEDYFAPAQRTAQHYQLTTEQGIALCFDIHVQNGSVGPNAQAAIQAALEARPPEDERALRIIIANAVADNAKPDSREDVRSRKLTIAEGKGEVHGVTFDLESWGLGDYPYEQS